MSPRPAYDHIVQAVSGIMSVTGTPETAPSRTGPPLVDYLTGHVGGGRRSWPRLRERDRTASAQRDRCRHARLRGGRHGLDHVGLCQWRRAGAADRQRGCQRRAVLRPVRDQDLAAHRRRQYRGRSLHALCGALGRPDLLADPRFCRTARCASATRTALRADHRRPPGRAARRSNGKRRWARRAFPSARCGRCPELLEDAQVTARELFRTLGLPGQDAGPHLPDRRLQAERRARRPGAAARRCWRPTTRPCLAELGYDADAAAGAAPRRGLLRNARHDGGRPACGQYGRQGHATTDDGGRCGPGTSVDGGSRRPGAGAGHARGERRLLSRRPDLDAGAGRQARRSSSRRTA